MNLSLGVKLLIIVIVVLFSVIIAMVAGLLSRTPGGPIASAILRAGGAFAAAMTLCLLTLTSLGVL